MAACLHPVITGIALAAGSQLLQCRATNLGWISVFALEAGVGLFVGFIWSLDSAALASLVVGGGWGLVLVVLYRVVTIGCHSLAWGRLLPAKVLPRWSRLLAFRWVSDWINALLPVAQVGGDFVLASLLWLRPGKGAPQKSEYMMEMPGCLLYFYKLLDIGDESNICRHASPTTTRSPRLVFRWT